jgi:hypothetical protein
MIVSRLYWGSGLALLAAVSTAAAADLARLPPNTWVEIKYTTVQPNDPAEKGSFAPQGWNKLVYDPDGKRVLFYDRWIDKKHGGYTIYGNCLFAFDPAADELTPLKIDHWGKLEPKGGGYRTVALPENARAPTPAPRHVYHAFEYVSHLNAVFLCNGANQTVIDKTGTLIGHDACDGVWRFDLKANKWTRIASTTVPRNVLDDAMAYCPAIKAMVYLSSSTRQLWIMDIATGEFRKAKASPPVRSAAGATILYDPTHKRMLIAGGGRLEGPFNEAKLPTLRELYAFDPKTESVKRLADCPTPLYEAHLAFDAKNAVFVMFAYDPKKDAWHSVKSTNPVPASKNWFGWVQLCYDAAHDCMIGKVRDKFYAFRYVH